MPWARRRRLTGMCGYQFGEHLTAPNRCPVRGPVPVRGVVLVSSTPPPHGAFWGLARSWGASACSPCRPRTAPRRQLHPAGRRTHSSAGRAGRPWRGGQRSGWCWPGMRKLPPAGQRGGGRVLCDSIGDRPAGVEPVRGTGPQLQRLPVTARPVRPVGQWLLASRSAVLARTLHLGLPSRTRQSWRLSLVRGELGQGHRWAHTQLL